MMTIILLNKKVSKKAIGQRMAQVSDQAEEMGQYVLLGTTTILMTQELEIIPYLQHLQSYSRIFHASLHRTKERTKFKITEANS